MEKQAPEPGHGLEPELIPARYNGLRARALMQPVAIAFVTASAASDLIWRWRGAQRLSIARTPLYQSVENRSLKMRVIVFAQDLSGRHDHGYYTKPDLASALDLFFRADGSKMSLDADGSNEITREDAEAAFATVGRITFYNEDGEQTIISADPSP